MPLENRLELISWALILLIDLSLPTGWETGRLSRDRISRSCISDIPGRVQAMLLTF